MQNTEAMSLTVSMANGLMLNPDSVENKYATPFLDSPDQPDGSQVEEVTL
jgi:hypothetical protein